MSSNNTDNKIKWDTRPFEELPKVGVLDPHGEKLNPLTGNEYSIEYKESAKQERHWSKLPFNEPKAQKKTFELLQKNQIILVKSGTGSGKSSQVPKFLSHLLGYKGKIAITIPTRISTLGSASYMAKSLDVEIGEEVGYKYRGTQMTNKNGKKTRILFTTDGTILSQLLGTNPDLSDLNALVIDEAHKRSTNIDMILLLTKELIKRRPDFKLLIVSATINAEIFRNYFPKPDFKFGEVEISTTPPFPIKHIWAKNDLVPDSTYYIPIVVKTILDILNSSDSGDILVFLPNVSDLGKACKLLEKENKNGLSFCLQASSDVFSGNENKKIMVTEHQINNPKRKVVMSTAVAEESLTIKNLDFVIDTGLNLMSSYDFKKMATQLNKEFITKSSAKQRAGRTGRLQAGTAYHLYTEKQFDKFPEFDTPEIKTINFAEIFLKVTNMPMVQTYEKALLFTDSLIEPPSQEAILSGVIQLRELGCYTKNNIKDLGELTTLGKAIAELGMEPAVSRGLILSNYHYVRGPIVFIYAIIEATKGRGLSDIYMQADDRRNKFNKLRQFLDKRGDYFTMLKIYNKFENYRKKHSFDQVKQWCKENYLRFYPLSQVRSSYFRMVGRVKSTYEKYETELKEIFDKTSKNKYKTDDAKVTQVIQEGEGLIRSAKQTKGDKYETIFPPEKTISVLGQETMLPEKTKPKKNIVYNDLFIGDGSSRFNTVLFY